MELEGLYDICFSLNLSMPLHSHFNVNVHRTFVKCVSPKSSSIGIRKLDLWRSKFFWLFLKLNGYLKGVNFQRHIRCVSMFQQFDYPTAR